MTKSNNAPTGNADVNSQVNDIAFRVILVPMFGIAIPLITGMITPSTLSNWQVKLSFGYTILIAFIIWEGNRFLHFSLRSYFDWHNKPLRKLAIVLLSISFYTIPVSVLMLIGWYKFFTNQPAQKEIITTSTLIIMICVIFITHVYETVFLVKESENEMLRNAKLERAKAEIELETLKSQIDPHFIFNSLNTLSHLIEVSPNKARLFNEYLADVYRYILQHKGQDLVLLKEEVDFLKAYIALISIRFNNDVWLKISLSEKTMESCLVPPISLQLLAENAVKHNEFSIASPLKIEIKDTADKIVVKNSIKKRETRKESPRVGLHNLQERYKLITGRSIIIGEDAESFEVALPLINL